MQAMEPALLIALLAAVAGPVGVSLGWWLGRRGERERQGREERKSAYVALVRAAIRFRNADSHEERLACRDERWTTLAEVILVAPPPIVQVAALWVSTGERLLDLTATTEQRDATLMEMWAQHVEFIRLARIDLGIAAADPFEGFEPVVGDRVTFRRRATGSA
jgi:hypothetical protein